MTAVRRIPALTLVVLVTSSTVARAATLQVGPGQTYTTIQSCIDAASPGDICNVHAGTYTEQLRLASGAPGNEITIRNNGGDTVTVRSSGSPVVDVFGSNHWVLEGIDLTYDGSGNECERNLVEN